MVVQSKETVDDELTVKREPASVCAVNVLAVPVVECGLNVVSEMVSEDSKERKMMER